MKDQVTTVIRGGANLVNDPAGAAATLDEHSGELGQVMGQALATAALAKALKTLNKPGTGIGEQPKWPSTPQEMDESLGFEGRRIPDTAATPGRSKVIWELSQNVKITYEQHPYHTTAPDWHKGPHWHLDTPGAPHVRYLPGDKIPGY